jgi:hypothetical protein
LLLTLRALDGYVFANVFMVVGDAPRRISLWVPPGYLISSSRSAHPIAIDEIAPAAYLAFVQFKDSQQKNKRIMLQAARGKSAPLR